MTETSFEITPEIQKIMNVVPTDIVNIIIRMKTEIEEEKERIEIREIGLKSFYLSSFEIEIDECKLIAFMDEFIEEIDPEFVNPNETLIKLYIFLSNFKDHNIQHNFIVRCINSNYANLIERRNEQEEEDRVDEENINCIYRKMEAFAILFDPDFTNFKSTLRMFKPILYKCKEYTERVANYFGDDIDMCFEGLYRDSRFNIELKNGVFSKCEINFEH